MKSPLTERQVLAIFRNAHRSEVLISKLCRMGGMDRRPGELGLRFPLLSVNGGYMIIAEEI
jgi:hypothetical protein